MSYYLEVSRQAARETWDFMWRHLRVRLALLFLATLIPWLCDLLVVTTGSVNPLNLVWGVSGAIVLTMVVFVYKMISVPTEMHAKMDQKISRYGEMLRPRMTVTARCGRQEFLEYHARPSWAALEVRNLNSVKSVIDVEVHITAVQSLAAIDHKFPKDRSARRFTIHDKGWDRVAVYWSGSIATSHSTKISIPPSSSRNAELAYSDGNGLNVWHLNAAFIGPDPEIWAWPGPHFISIEVSAADCPPVRQKYCLGYYSDDGSRGPMFEMTPWDEWRTDKCLALPEV